MCDNKIIYLLLAVLPLTMGAIPGTFYWRPRMSIDLNVPTTESSYVAHYPSKDTVAEGVVVMVDGYSVGMTVIGMAAGLSSGGTYPHLNPISAYFYTNVYRWGLRYFSLLPSWMSGHGGNYVETHRVWRRRFYYMDEFMPEWMKKLFPYVKEDEWKKEELEFKRFKKYAEPAFGKHYRFPAKKFNNFQSQLTVETIDDLDESSNSI